MSPHVISDRVGDEEEMSKYAGDMQVFDEYTGDALPPALVSKAREEEVSMMEDWEVWDVITEEILLRPGYELADDPVVEDEEDEDDS